MSQVIPVSEVYDAIVDDDLYVYLNQWKWSINSSGYATGSRGLMHRLVLPDVDEVHHINGDRLDNRRANLKSTTHANNLYAIVEPQKNNKSGYRGVVAKGNRYYAYLVVDKKQRYLGSFDTAEAASWAYEIAKEEAKNNGF